MIKIRKSGERGHFDHGWLNTYHTFSFAEYEDPDYMGFRNLRVINEDRVQPGEGFGKHSHRDMEILTYVLEGALEHKDSLGNGSVIRRGDIQRMSAGTGVTHSEFNASKKEPVHFLQVWILPEKKGIPAGYEQARIQEADRKNRLCLIASSRSKNGVLKIHQDVELFTAILDKGEILDCPLKAGRHAWLQIAAGVVKINGNKLKAGDGAAISNEPRIEIKAAEDSELLLFDLK